jgi:hypothetical protein
MTFQEFLSQIQTLRIEESRAQTDDYFEAVIAKANLDPLHKILTDYFGPPLKPEGQSPSWKANKQAKPYGGIRKDQTMYFHQGEEHSECVLLWPWGSGARITVKVSQSKRSGLGSGWLGSLKKLFVFKS